MARRIGAAEIVDRVDDAATEQVKPNAIDGGPREKGILRTRQPARQDLAPISMSRNGWIGVPEKFWRNHLAGPRLDDLALMSGKDCLLFVVNLNEERTITILQAGEKGRQAVIIVLR